MKRALLIAVATVFFSASAADLNSVTATDQAGNVAQILTQSRAARARPLTDELGATSGQCCKICHQGKACGDTCISRQDTCHVGPGCACDG